MTASMILRRLQSRLRGDYGSELKKNGQTIVEMHNLGKRHDKYMVDIYHPFQNICRFKE